MAGTSCSRQQKHYPTAQVEQGVNKAGLFIFAILCGLIGFGAVTLLSQVH